MMLSVVLPCYNEEKNIEHAVRDVQSWMREDGIEGEIIVVNDGSYDGSRQVLERLRRECPSLKVIHREKNGGYGIAVRDGCDKAAQEWIAFMDSDGQFHAKDLALLALHTKDYPFVTGRRLKRADPFLRNVFGKLLALMNWVVLGLWVRDINCGMKIFRRSVWPSIRPVHGVEKLFNTEIFLRLKRQHIPWLQVNVPHYPRRAGTPTGGSARVILRMFRELSDLRRAQHS